MVLGKLPVLGCPTNLDKSRARAYCTCSRCGWGCLNIFSLIYLFSFLSPSLWEMARYRLKYCLEGPLSPKQPTSYKRTNKIFLIFNSLNTNTSYLNDFSTTVKSHNLCYIAYDIQTGIHKILFVKTIFYN